MLRMLRTLPLLTLATLPVLGGCGEEPRSHLERIQAEGELVVATREAPTSYQRGSLGPTGPEYAMARRFADQLGVQLRMEVFPGPEALFAALDRREADLAAAALTRTEERALSRPFGPAYQYVSALVVHRGGVDMRPEDVGDLVGRRIGVVPGSSHVDFLEEARTNHPGLAWVEVEEATTEGLLRKVHSGEFDYTIMDSHEFQAARRYFPELRAALDLSGPQPLAWALSKGADGSLEQRVEDFFDTIKTDGSLARILDHHYAHIQEFDYVNVRSFMRQVEQRLPRFQSLFEDAASHTDLDWRLLAATGYQESHWRAGAISPTGVRGVMMLTQPTAKYVGVSRRTDPAQSIHGGARYLRVLKDRLADVPEPDRTWLALAAYNVGHGHLQDARRITERQGGDPDAWVEVKKRLPLLRQKAWYTETEYGYARGDEAVTYVENIRTYYDILRRLRGPEGDATTLARAS
ncbi:membrane-bound lytic murein transglycosylase F [Thiohalospira halophila DSM 15071]|uniref:Membrane-bound lytic murein transglycosylase F n=1 Tax=Thiohalospira halophila DSM 15071 TaxID=1123397 RepID=A0A1I1WH85_9GAMM|nr:membrane-bound lytic murein transglycosylase MltF [Thiohalospira halophila]SFD94349.1 membrane-bound lytic murein transglycosylase F [Thiohalospira halophila DSM 15071]